MKIKKLKIKLNKDNEYSDYRYFIPKSNNIKMTDGRDVDEAVQSLKDKIANLKEQANYLIDKAPLVKYAEGTSITITDCAEAPLRKFSIEGDSYQETREGYNKFNSDNLIGITPTSIGTSYIINEFDIDESGIYTIVSNLEFYYNFKDSNDNTIMNGNTSSGIAKITITDDNINTIQKMMIFINEGSLNKVWTKLMLLKGEYTLNNSPEYEQYGASPSIEYESPIESVGDNINLFDKETITNQLVNSDTGAITSNSAWRLSEYIEVIPLTDYMFSWKSSHNYFQVRIRMYDESKTYLKTVKYELNNTFAKTFTTIENCKYIRVNYSVNVSGTEAIRENIKLEKGTKATPYSPYGQGSVEIYNCNKNLFDISKYPFTQRVAYNGDKLVWWTGYYGIQGYFPVKEQETYSFSNDLGLPIAFGLVFYDKDKNAISSISKDTTTFATPEKCKYIRFAIKSATLPTWVQIEKGETATEYIPHQSQTKALYTQQPFKAIGDVKDRFIKKDGIWYEEHKIDRYIFTGNEGWKKSSRTDVNRYYVSNIINTILNASTVDILCSHFKALTPSQSDTGMIGISKYNETGLMVNVDLTNTELDTVDKSKAKLTELYNAGTPVYVDYVLATPTLIECTAEQVEVLESLQSYDKITYYSVDKTNNVQANIKLIYKQDINAILEGEGV